MSHTSERNHSQSYRLVHGSTLEDPGFDSGCVDAEVGNCPESFLAIMTLSADDNLLVCFPIVQT